MSESKQGDDSEGGGGGGESPGPENESDNHLDEEPLTPAALVKKYAISENIYTRERVGRIMLQVMRDTPADVLCADLPKIMDTAVVVANDPETLVRAELVEQIPHLAMICMESNIPSVSNAVHDYLFPIIVQQLVDPDTQVKKAAQGALLMLMENGLVSRSEVERSACPMVISLSKDWSEENQTSAVALMAKMVPLLGKDATERLFLKRFSELCCSLIVNVRKFCAANIGEFCAIIGASESYEQIILPCYVELCADETWAVRKACAEVIMSVSCACPPVLRRAVLAPAFIPLLNDKSRWVSSAAFQTLGPFISTFANPQITGLAYSQNGELVLINPDGVEFKLHAPACTDNNYFPLDQFFYDIYSSKEQKQSEPEIMNIATEFNKYPQNHLNKHVNPQFTSHDNNKTNFEVAIVDALNEIFEGSNNESNRPNCTAIDNNCDEMKLNECAEAVMSDSTVTVGPENKNLSSEQKNEFSETENCHKTFNSENGPKTELNTNLTTVINDHNYISTAELGMQNTVVDVQTNITEKPVQKNIKSPEKQIEGKEDEGVLNETSKESEAIIKVASSLPTKQQTSNVENVKAPVDENKNRKGRNRNKNKLKSAAIRENQQKETVHNDDEEENAQQYLVRNNLNVAIDSADDKLSFVTPDAIKTELSVAGGDCPERGVRSYADVVADCNCSPSIDSNSTSTSPDVAEISEKPFINKCDEKSAEPDNECLDKYNSFNYWYISPDLPLELDIAEFGSDSIVQKKESNNDRSDNNYSDVSNQITSVKNENVDDFEIKTEKKTKKLFSEVLLDGEPNEFESLAVEQPSVQQPTVQQPAVQQSAVQQSPVQQSTLHHIEHPSTQQIVPQSLVDHYVSMAQSKATDVNDSDLCYHCAFSFPAVAMTLGIENWGLLHKAYCALAVDIQWKVRRTVAGSLHELATILGEAIATEHLAPIFDEFIKDLDEVRIGVLKHMAHFFSLIRSKRREQYLPHLKNFLMTDAQLNWRFRAELANQLLLSIPLWSPKDVSLHIAPLAVHLLQDKIAAVRSSAIMLISDLINYIQSDTADTSRILAELAEQFAHSKRWVRRQTFATLCSRIVSRRRLSVDTFARDLMPHLLDLCWDPVPNVRLTVAKTVANDLMKHEYFSVPTCMYHESLNTVLKRLQTDKDRDVRQAASIKLPM